MTKQIRHVQPGDVVTRVPYPGDDRNEVPLTVEAVVHARQNGSRILVGKDAAGNHRLIPVGHFTNECEVRS